MGESGDDDRRIYERFHPTECTLRCAKEGLLSFLKSVPAEVVNVSANGLRLRTRVPLTVGEWMTGKLYLRDKLDVIKFRGQVVWARMDLSQSSGSTPMTLAGIRFDRSDRDLVEKIEMIRRWYNSTERIANRKRAHTTRGTNRGSRGP